MTRIEFHVEGDPVPQGSVKSFKAKNGAIVTTNDSSGRLGRWRGDIRTAAKTARPSACLIEGAVSVAVHFSFARPQSHYLPANGKRPERMLRLDVPDHHAGKPDADRLLRGVLDALTSVLFRDDSQVAMVHVTKRWARDPGADIIVTELLP